MHTEQKVTRKLRALLSADVKGYSLLMSHDEIFTIETLKAYRKIMSEYIQRYNARVVDSPGDNLLAEFESAVDSVQCAIEIQKEVKNKLKVEFEYIGDAITEEIITGLANIPLLFVIARNSSNVYKGKQIKIKKI